MKKILFLIVAISSMALLSSCTDKDTTEIADPITTYRIIGRWQLLQVDLGLGGTKNCSEKNIEYQFLSNGKLIVSDDSEEDGRGIFLTRGEHQYVLNEKTSQITIDSSTYQYQIKDKELIIDTGSAWDAPVYIFKLINQ